MGERKPKLGHYLGEWWVCWWAAAKREVVTDGYRLIEPMGRGNYFIVTHTASRLPKTLTVLRRWKPKRKGRS